MEQARGHGPLYAYMNLVNGNQGEALTPEELREVVCAFNVPTMLV